MKKCLFIFLILSISFFNAYSQIVEKIFETDEVKYTSREPARFAPYGICIDELNNSIEIMNGSWEGSNTFNFEGKHIVKSIAILPKTIECYYKMNNLYIGSYDTNISIEKDSEFLAWVNTAKSGISFILKKGNGYIVYYVDTNGYPGAVDTEGKIYSNQEAMEYLKLYDPEKYDQSKKRAAELELYNDFICNRVLIWGKRYYKPIKGGSLYQYDNQGNRYGCNFFWWGDYKNDWGTFCEVGTESTSNLFCFNINEERFIFDTTLNNYSTILGRNGDYQEIRPEYSTSWYVGFGGNIYYYIAGEEYTEVFRIRRTWGEPDFYAMAINGYTEDEYGKYVNEVLPKLSKADLRLLRNTIFALYGVHFKSADLSKYFDKQVWYIDEGKTSADVTLPEHRQKLVEMIQKLEK